MIPVVGVILFIILYFIAANLYPGGSQGNHHSVGFSWTANYWCNLLAGTAMNGQVNPARPVAIAGMLVLCLTLSAFFYIFPRYSNSSRLWTNIIRLSGIIGVSLSFLLLAAVDHDVALDLACFFGLIAFAGVLKGLYSNECRPLFWFGIFNLLLVAVNNYVYYSGGLISALPLIQKFTFISFLAWIAWVSFYLYRQGKGLGETSTTGPAGAGFTGVH